MSKPAPFDEPKSKVYTTLYEGVGRVPGRAIHAFVGPQGAMREYHCHVGRDGSAMRVPRPRFMRAGVLVVHAEGTEALLRSRPTSFCNL